MASDLLTELRKIPPITRFLCGSSVVFTAGHVLQVVSLGKLGYLPQLVFSKRFEIWRLYTCFFPGPQSIYYIFDLFMLYRTVNELESGPYMRKSADLGWQLSVACATILTVTSPLKPFLFSRPLLVCLAYLSSALAPVGSQTSLMGLVSLDIKYLPYIMIGFDLLSYGPSAAANALAGALVGHLWWWTVWGSALGGGGGPLEQYARAPQWFSRWMGDEISREGRGPGAGRGANPNSGVQVIPPRQAATATGVAGRPQGGYNWGSGRRLGES